MKSNKDFAAVFCLNEEIRLNDGSTRAAGIWPVAKTLSGSYIAFREFCKTQLDEMASSGVLDDYIVVIGQATFQLKRPTGEFMASWAITFNEMPINDIQDWWDAYNLPTKLAKPYPNTDAAIEAMEQWLRENGSDDRGPACAVYDELGYYLGLDPRIKTRSELERRKSAALLSSDKSYEDLIKDP